jgi:hypothetical protein
LITPLPDIFTCHLRRQAAHERHAAAAPCQRTAMLAFARHYSILMPTLPPFSFLHADIDACHAFAAAAAAATDTLIFAIIARHSGRCWPLSADIAFRYAIVTPY